jgi:hypothetical protein
LHRRGDGAGKPLKPYQTRQEARETPGDIISDAHHRRDPHSRWLAAFTTAPESIRSASPLDAQPEAPRQEVEEELRAVLQERCTPLYQLVAYQLGWVDEVGTPYCFTIDGQTLTDQTVTVRERDTAAQQRIAIDKVEAFLAEHLHSA